MPDLPSYFFFYIKKKKIFFERPWRRKRHEVSYWLAFLLPWRRKRHEVSRWLAFLFWVESLACAVALQLVQASDVLNYHWSPTPKVR